MVPKDITIWLVWPKHLVIWWCQFVTRWLCRNMWLAILVWLWSIRWRMWWSCLTEMSSTFLYSIALQLMVWVIISKNTWHLFKPRLDQWLKFSIQSCCAIRDSLAVKCLEKSIIQLYISATTCDIDLSRKCFIFISSESSYFAPSFVELTSMDVVENMRQMKDRGLTFPIGMF